MLAKEHVTHTPNSPNHFSIDPGSHFEEVGSVFHIGDPTVSMDIQFKKDLEQGPQRFYAWEMTPADEQLADMARWQEYVAGTYGGFTYLDVPNGTRAARSILGGVEAWQGEKADIIQFIEDYEGDIYNRFNAVDASVSLDTVARTKDRKGFFITPPHHLVGDREEAKAWLERLQQELDEVLLTDENRKHLVEQFSDMVKQLPNGGEQ